MTVLSAARGRGHADTAARRRTWITRPGTYLVILFVLPIFIMVFFGNVDLYVPEGIAADVTGLTVLGHRREWGRDATQLDAPVLRVHVAAFFGTVDVWRVPTGLRGNYRELIGALRTGQRELPG